ncbi:hypothetical protein [Streptomyces sp. KS 21]|uniref:hypothetical protein n=1 Tax=Streptomyces sp. KS 21 TaxID=2485150 RepID=UPI0010E37419|nr:hypothetical protein [Streptomyces sp. KS 21]TDU74675.1 mercuric ion transport protein [Streptomyces sp. KS 21]
MNPRAKSSGKTVLGAGALAALACAACCIGPILGLLGAVGTASAVGAFWVPALAVFTVLALAGTVWVLRRRRRSACRTEQSAPVDPGFPTPAPRKETRGRLRRAHPEVPGEIIGQARAVELGDQIFRPLFRNG